MDLIRFNYFAICFLVIGLFQFYAATIAFSVKDRSESTKQLGFLFISMALFCMAYAVAHSLLLPVAAFHRWVTVFTAPVTTIFMAMIFLYFPGSRKTRFAKGLFWTLLIATIAVETYFIVETLKLPIVFNFSSHLYDFDSDELSRRVGLFILLVATVYPPIAVTRIVREKAMRRPLAILLCGAMLATYLPSIGNILSRSGYISRGAYVTMYMLLGVMGCFLIIVMFINNTRDRTSFMAKITSITLATILVSMLNTAFFALGDREQAFDDSKMKDSRLAEATNRKAPGSVFRVQWDSENTPETAYRKDARVSHEVANAELVTLLSEGQSIEEISNDLPAGLSSGLKEYVFRAANRRDLTPAALLSELYSFQKPMSILAFKIQELKPEKVAEATPALLAKQKSELEPLMNAIALELKTPSADLKERILAELVPVYPADHRYYRVGERDGMLYVSYLVASSDSAVEYGYPYMLYRTYVHEGTMPALILILAVALIVMFGFRWFFSGALVRPIDNLLAGVTRVNAGALDVQIQPGVEDEIGFLTRSFNGMVTSIREAQEKLQDYAAHLEEKVKERTAELRTTLEEVQALKLQQDGDYFLTSLLLKPLGSNRARSETVNVEFFMRQKKKFQFRHWQEEIGGDMCISDNLTLAGRPFTVFLNSDAMGKSMQGAGGALVLGSVFESVLERTKSTNIYRDQYPERWIKSAFIELHKVFDAFDGSMLVSLFLGVLDETTGLLYSINAEHPWTIMYRDGKAQFIEDEFAFRKLGMPGVGGDLKISIFQLLPGDVVIAGSDGRDDIESETNGVAVINEDETRILHHVEAGKGRLETIYESLALDGRLIDDFSMVRVGYREGIRQEPIQLTPQTEALMREATELTRSGHLADAIPKLQWAHSLEKTQPDILKALCRAFIQARRFKEAAPFLELYVTLVPADTDYVYIASFCFKKAGKLKKAADLGERVRLRNPSYVKNLLNLADVYFQLKNFDRSSDIFQRVLDLEPSNRLASRAMARLEQPEEA